MYYMWNDFHNDWKSLYIESKTYSHSVLKNVDVVTIIMKRSCTCFKNIDFNRLYRRMSEFVALSISKKSSSNKSKSMVSISKHNFDMFFYIDDKLYLFIYRTLSLRYEIATWMSYMTARNVQSSTRSNTILGAMTSKHMCYTWFW